MSSFLLNLKNEQDKSYELDSQLTAFNNITAFDHGILIGAY